jgi:hypothetical protein
VGIEVDRGGKSSPALELEWQREDQETDGGLDRLQKMGTAPAIDLMKYRERLARKGEL